LKLRRVVVAVVVVVVVSVSIPSYGSVDSAGGGGNPRAASIKASGKMVDKA
jgi:hypothetical protein